MKRNLAIIAVASLTFAGGAAAAPTAIPAGKYHCKTGHTRMMLTLGDMQISGMRYTFKPQVGPSTSGSYAILAEGYRWTGDIGEIKNAQIETSGSDISPGTFWFQFKVNPTSLPRTVSCTRVSN